MDVFVQILKSVKWNFGFWLNQKGSKHSIYNLAFFKMEIKKLGKRPPPDISKGPNLKYQIAK